MLTSDEISQMRSVQEKAMPDTVYVQRLTRVDDGAGGWSEVWQTVATVKGRVAPRATARAEGTLGSAVTPVVEYIVTLPAGTEVYENDRLQIDGVQYEITSNMTRSQATAVRLLCERIGG